MAANAAIRPAASTTVKCSASNSSHILQYSDPASSALTSLPPCSISLFSSASAVCSTAARVRRRALRRLPQVPKCVILIQPLADLLPALRITKYAAIRRGRTYAVRGCRVLVWGRSRSS